MSNLCRPQREFTEIEQRLYKTAHIDYARVSIVCRLQLPIVCKAENHQIANPSVAELYEDALVYESGSAITSTGAMTAFSGAKTGRSPLDKRIVREPSSEKEVWWGPVNKDMTPQVSRGRSICSRQFACAMDGILMGLTEWRVRRGEGATPATPPPRITTVHHSDRLT